MAVTYIYEYIPHNEYVRYFDTTNDVTLLSNADGYTDRGQFQYQDTWNSSGNYSSTAIDLSGSDNRLTIGGNFDDADRYCYEVLEDPDPNGVPHDSLSAYDDNDYYNQKYYNDRANVFYRGNNIRDDAAAIRFRNNGVLFLTADTGAGTAHDASDRDDNIRIVSVADTYRDGGHYSEANVPPGYQ